MKFEEKRLAREMRRQGCSCSEILAQVRVSKGTLSLWLRDIALTDAQIARLESRHLAGREKFILGMRARRDRRWAQYQQEAEDEWPLLCQDPDLMFGLALYIGEGTKAMQNEICITNCDARVIQKGLSFFLKIGVPQTALRCAITTHPGLSKASAEEFWQQATGLPPEQFYVTRDAVSRSSGGKKGNIQVFGTCQIRASATKMRQKLTRWMDLALMARWSSG